MNILAKLIFVFAIGISTSGISEAQSCLLCFSPDLVQDSSNVSS